MTMLRDVARLGHLAALAASLMAALAITASAANVTGHARVVDGDTIHVGAFKIRLQGIDAPERAKPGGGAATASLQKAVSTTPVTCELTGEATYDRMVAVCWNADGSDLAAEVIRSGAALDCRHYSGGRYRSLETPDARARLHQARYC